MDDNALDDLLRRLTTLVVKLDETYNHLVLSYDQLVAMHQDHQVVIREQQEFNRQQVRINADVSATLARLDTLMTEVFRQRANGRDA